MATKVFFLNSDVTEYGEYEMNYLQKFLLESGILNTEGSDWEDFADMKVAQRGAGANMSVDVAAGYAVIETTRTTTFKIFAGNTAVVNVPIASNSSGSNRVDAIILRISRSADPNVLANNVATIERVAGTGASALSDGAITTAISNDDFLRLADVTVPNAAASIVTGNIADTRVRCVTSDAFTFSPTVVKFREVATDPDTALLEGGEVWFNTTQGRLKLYDGALVVTLGVVTVGTFNPLLAQEQSTPGLTLQVAAGVVVIADSNSETVVKYAGGNSPTFTAPSANPRIDLLTIDSAGTLARTAGTEAASPTAPTYPADKFVICEVYNKVGQTSVKNTSDGTNGYIYKDSRSLVHPDFQSRQHRSYYTLGEAITAPAAVYLNVDDNKIYKTDLSTRANARKSIRSFLGILTESGTTNDSRRVAHISSVIGGFSFGNAVTTVSSEQDIGYTDHSNGGISLYTGITLENLVYFNQASKVNKIAVYVGTESGNGGNVTVELYEVGDDGNAVGSALASKQVLRASITANAENDFTFASPVAVDPLKQYIIRFTGTGSNSSNYWPIGYGGAPIDPVLNPKRNGTSGAWDTSRHHFIVYRTEKRNWTVGDKVYLDTSTPGGLTITAPYNNDFGYQASYSVGTIIDSSTIRLSMEGSHERLLEQYKFAWNSTTVGFQLPIPKNTRKAVVFISAGSNVGAERIIFTDLYGDMNTMSALEYIASTCSITINQTATLLKVTINQANATIRVAFYS